MHVLTHYRLCPRSRSLRLTANELKLSVDLVEQEPWAIGPQFLALNPAGELPVLQMEGGPVLCGVYAAAEYLCQDHAEQAETTPAANTLYLYPTDGEERAEVRRLADWFHNKLDREVTRELLYEKLYTRMTPNSDQSPSAGILRVARSNLKYHMGYMNYLADQRQWLAGDTMSFADLAGAAHLSTLDYLGEIDWDAYPVAKSWYQRMKSRPSFRPLLADRVPGTPPPQCYADLDF